MPSSRRSDPSTTCTGCLGPLPCECGEAANLGVKLGARLRIVPTPEPDAPDLHRVDAGQEGGPWRPICSFPSKERAVEMAESLGLPVDIVPLASPTAALRRDYTDADPTRASADPRLIAALDLLDAVAQRLPIRDLEARLARLSG